ncbi:MAG: hypothetical protein R3292_06675 [Alcanivorax sp.]|nr:hypothetical protein [Alcanivorax sp.]
MRTLLVFCLLLACGLSRAESVRVLKYPPHNCQALKPVAVHGGSFLQGLLFSDDMIERNAAHALEKAVKKEGGNRAVISERRAYMMENHNRGMRRINLKADVWHCDEPPQKH